MRVLNAMDCTPEYERMDTCVELVQHLGELQAQPQSLLVDSADQQIIYKK